MQGACGASRSSKGGCTRNGLSVSVEVRTTHSHLWLRAAVPVMRVRPGAPARARAGPQARPLPPAAAAAASSRAACMRPRSPCVATLLSPVFLLNSRHPLFRDTLPLDCPAETCQDPFEVCAATASLHRVNRQTQHDEDSHVSLQCGIASRDVWRKDLAAGHLSNLPPQIRWRS